MKTEFEEMNKALMCLNLACSGEVAEDVKTKVYAAYDVALNKLPSTFKPNDLVDLEFFEGGRIKGCIIEAVRFEVDKVLYDVAIQVVAEKKLKDEKDAGKWTVIRNVDSVFVERPQ